MALKVFQTQTPFYRSAARRAFNELVAYGEESMSRRSPAALVAPTAVRPSRAFAGAALRAQPGVDGGLADVDRANIHFAALRTRRVRAGAALGSTRRDAWLTASATVMGPDQARLVEQSMDSEQLRIALLADLEVCCSRRPAVRVVRRMPNGRRNADCNRWWCRRPTPATTWHRRCGITCSLGSGRREDQRLGQFGTSRHVRAADAGDSDGASARARRRGRPGGLSPVHAHEDEAARAGVCAVAAGVSRRAQLLGR